MQLFALRSEKGVTQDTVAKAIGVKRYTYAKWEQGKAEPCISDIIKLCNYFNCTFEYLVGVENDYFSSKKDINTTKKENELLSSFNLLSEEDQNKVIGFIKALEK